MEIFTARKTPFGVVVTVCLLVSSTGACLVAAGAISKDPLQKCYSGSFERKLYMEQVLQAHDQYLFHIVHLYISPFAKVLHPPLLKPLHNRLDRVFPYFVI